METKTKQKQTRKIAVRKKTNSNGSKTVVNKKEKVLQVQNLSNDPVVPDPKQP
tara:strand:+ start:1727 stop:1885 length:159 start_codon:yes stop_codon:yes gene_type:complete